MKAQTLIEVFDVALQRAQGDITRAPTEVDKALAVGKVAAYTHTLNILRATKDIEGMEKCSKCDIFRGPAGCPVYEQFPDIGCCAKYKRTN